MTNTGENLHAPLGNMDPHVTLQNLEGVRTRMDELQRFLSGTVRSNTVISSQHMSMVTSEISSALRHLIFNAAALLSTTSKPEPVSKLPKHPSREELVQVKQEGETEHEKQQDGRGERLEDDGVAAAVVEVDAVELLAEHTHFCQVCGKGFKRDANLRMHMRAHGDRFKSHDALSKPEMPVDVRKLRTTRFSCPFEGCIRLLVT